MSIFNGSMAYSSSIEPREARAYTAARRHSVVVRALRWLIPVGGAAAIVGLVAWTWLDPFGRISNLSLGPVSFEGGKIAMESPRLTGYRKDLRPYEVTAEAALQDVRKPNVIELKTLKADLAMDETARAKLEAVSGVFDNQKEKLELRDNVRVRSDNGYDARLASASIDFKAGTVASREPVKVDFRGGTINADSLDISDNGKKIVFQGRVRTVLDNDAPAAKPSISASQNTGLTP